MNSQIVSFKADEAVNWFQKRIKYAVNYGLSSEEYKTFEIFMTSTLSDVDIKKQITNTVLPKFFENLISRKINKQTIDAQASIIRLFMKYYGATSSQFKSTLDKFTSKTLSECFNEENIMVKVTKYLALYPQCGGRGQQGINHVEAWTNQFNDYLYSANYFLNLLYSNIDFFMGINVMDEYEGKFDVSIFNLPSLEHISPKERYEKLTSLFIFFNTAIQSMLLSMFSTVKRFDSNQVIQFALRTLSVTSEKLNATIITEDVIALDSVLWKLHCSAIKTVSALIKCCGRILIPHGILICRILLQSINMTNLNSSNYVYGTTRSKLQQRVLTYQVLCSWQAVAGSQSSLEMFSESLISGLLFDIKYDKPSLNLIVDKKIGNKKRKSGALNEKIMNQRDTIVMHDYHANKVICNEAHVTLQLFLNTMSSALKPLQFKIFQSTIMGLLLEIIKCQRPNDYPLPYYDDSCRLNLYKSLLAIVISPHPQCIAQTSVALRLFTLGTTDRNEKVKEVCRSSLSKLEHIIRPRNDTLFFPLDNEIEIPQSTQNTKPENKNYFLTETIEDSFIISKAKQPAEISSNSLEREISSTQVIKPIDKSKTDSITIKESLNKIDLIKDDEVNVENSVKPVITKPLQEISTDKSLAQEMLSSKKIPTTIVENIINSTNVTETDKTEDVKDDEVVEMLDDFIDDE